MLESNAEISEFILFEFICHCFLLSQISLVLGPSFVGCGSIRGGFRGGGGGRPSIPFPFVSSPFSLFLISLHSSSSCF